MARARSEEFKTPPCRLSFANGLFKPRAQQEGGKESYGCTLIFQKNVDRSVLDNAVKKVIVDEWGEKGLDKAKNGLIKLPFLDGAGKEAYNKKTGELNSGMGSDVFFIRPSANKDYPPVVRFKSPTIPATEAEVYSGCHGFAVLTAYAWSHPQNGDGVSFGIAYFQKTGEGERFGGGGGVDVDKFFEKVEDTGNAPEETKGGAGAGGLFG
jgi:hypothetical protein